MVNERDGWLQITSPVRGWVAKNRTVTACNNTGAFIARVMRRVDRLGDEAVKGNRAAGDNLIGLVGRVDGAMAAMVNATLARWAGSNPKFLIAVLDTKIPNIRLRTLQSMNFGFRDGKSQERQRFEPAIRALPNSVTVRVWKSGNYAR